MQETEPQPVPPVDENEYPLERPLELPGNIDQLMRILMQKTALAKNPIHFVWQNDIFTITDTGIVGPKDDTPDASTDVRLEDLQKAADRAWGK